MDRVYLYTFYIFRFFIRYTPKVILNPLLNLFIWFTYEITPKHKKITQVNLDLVFGDFNWLFLKKARHTPSIALQAKRFDAVFITTDDYLNYLVKFKETFMYKDTGERKGIS